MNHISYYLKASLFLVAVNTFADNMSSIKEAWIDNTTPPSKNFFLFANGQWIKNHPIPENEAEWGIFNILDRQIDEQMRQMLTTLPQHPKLYERKINQELFTFYQSGMDTQTIEQAKITPIQPIINAIKTIHDPKSLYQTLAKLQQLGMMPLFSFSSFPSLHQKQFVISQINQGGLMLPDRSYYLVKDEKNKKILEAYQTFITHMFIESGLSKDEAQKAFHDVLTIETKLAEFSEEVAYFRNPKNIDHVTPIETIKKSYPNIDFTTFFNDMGFASLQSTNLSQPKYFEKLNQYLPTVSYQSLQHYFMAHLFYNLSSSLNDAYSKSYCEFSKAIRGNTSCKPRWLDVIGQENQLLGFAVGDLYVANYEKPGEIEYINNMLSGIKLSLKQKIEQSSWLSADTQQKALHKLAKMSSRVGYPKPLDYSKLNIHSKIYVENVLEAVRWYMQHELSKIGHPVDLTEWNMAPQSVNAYYDVTQNQINIPLGILQPPFFSMEAPVAFNYGGIGVVIGHELFHGFDDEGSQFDADGIYHKWWTAQEWQEYQKRVNCIVQQFSSYPIPNTNINVKGKLVSGEAIADLGGVTLSLDAFMHSEAYKTAQNLEGFTPTQQFFIRFAQIWAANTRPEEAKRRGLIDPHPPKIYRVNGTLSNVPMFYQSFNIPTPEHMCTIF